MVLVFLCVFIQKVLLDECERLLHGFSHRHGRHFSLVSHSEGQKGLCMRFCHLIFKKIQKLCLSSFFNLFKLNYIFIHLLCKEVLDAALLGTISLQDPGLYRHHLQLI